MAEILSNFCEARTEVKFVKSPSLGALSFVKKIGKGKGYNYWTDVEATGSYSEDCKIGRASAEEFIAFIGKYHNDGNARILGSIVIDMEKNGATKGHKIGFLNTINEYAMIGGYLEASQGSPPTPPLHAEDRLSRIKAQITDLSDHEDLHSLFDALRTIGNVLSSVGQSPKFWKDRDGFEYTPAGEVLDELTDTFDFIIDDVINHVKKLPAPTRHDQIMKALTIGAWEVFCGSVPEEIVAALAPLTTDKH